MAITKDGVRMYDGAVLREEEHMWMDGMLEVHVVVWDMEKHKEKRIQTGYYGSDGCNLCGDTGQVDFEVSNEVARDILRTLKKNAISAYCTSVKDAKSRITKGTTAEVVKGRKIPQGTVLEVFWVGEKPTWKSQQYHWMNETEEIAGCYDKDGNKVWIKTEYLKNIDPIKSPVTAERKKFIRAYVTKNTTRMIRKAARNGIDKVTW